MFIYVIRLGPHFVTHVPWAGTTTHLTRVSSDNANIAAEHQEAVEVLSQLGNTSNPPVYGNTSVASVAASGVLVAASGVVCDNSLFSLEIAVSKNQNLIRIPSDCDWVW